MALPPEIILTVTNDLAFDQRMQRICSSLSQAGYKVTLVGRLLAGSPPTADLPFCQVRLACRFTRGKLFYLEYNWRLYRYLVNRTREKIGTDMAVCAIDLDTILPVLRISKKRKLPRVYDAHELFTELTEVKRRPMVSAIWQRVEKLAVPQFPFGYTVNGFIAGELKNRYAVNYEVIRNMPYRQMKEQHSFTREKYKIPHEAFFLYQGAVNEGRSFETLIPAMKIVRAKLVIAGDGNFMEQAKTIAKKEGLEEKIIFTGLISPAELRQLTPLAFAGITIFQEEGLNQYYSLANRYFDYIQAGIPQVCVDYPEYAALNKLHETAVLVEDVSPVTLSLAMNKLLSDIVLYSELKNACTNAAEEFCWERESKHLVAYWKKLLPLESN